MTQYIKVSEAEDDEEPIEIPCEIDNTILLTTLTSLFPGASGLKYRNAESGTMRGLRLIDGKLQAPDQGWETVSIYYCCFPKENKRKIEDQADNLVNTKTKRIEEKKCSDLIVLGLAWKTTDKELREYFEQMGELLMAQVKKDPKSGMSKGFGFIRFSDYDSQVKAVTKRHCIDGRWCDVRIPMSKDGFTNENRDRNQEFNRKIFIGRITSDISVDDLRDYFSKYGDISDIFIPKPFRGFAFVTFGELFVNQEHSPTLYSNDHIINGISVHVSNAVPKVEMNNHISGQHHQPPGHPPAPGPYSSTTKPYGRYSSYPSPAHPNHMGGSPSVNPGHPSTYSPSNYSPPAAHYESMYASHYPRQRSSQHSYTDSGTTQSLYSHRYGSFNSPDYSSYY